jgi:hypothetical protein
MNNLERPLQEGYELSPSKYLETGWKLFNKEIGTFIGMTFLFFLIQFVISLIPIVSAFNNLLTTVLTSGYYVYARNIKRQNNEAKDFFAGFNYLKDIFLYLLTFFLLLVPVGILVFLIAAPSIDFFQSIVEVFSSGDPDAFGRLSYTLENVGPLFFLGMGLFALLAIYRGVSYLFVIPLTVDGQMTFWNAMELSRQTVGKRFFTVLFALFILGLMMIVGSLVTCFVGLLLITPLYYCIVFEAYEDIFKPYEGEEEDEIEQFGQIEEDINTESQERAKENNAIIKRSDE